MFSTLIKIRIFSILIIKCLCTTEEKSTQDLMKGIKTSYLCLHDPKLSTIFYYIDLYVEKKDQVIGRKNVSFSSLSKDHKKCSMDMYNENMIQSLINELKEKKQFNHNITFNFKSNKFELFNFIKSFLIRLEENQIDKVEIMYDSNELCDNFYSLNDFYAEKYKEDLIILRKLYNIEDKCLYLEKTCIKGDYLTNLMKLDTKCYLKNMSYKNDKELFFSYFLNHKLFLLDLDPMMKEAEEMVQFKIESKKFYKKGDNCIPNILYLHMLFYFLKDSYFLYDMIKKSHASCGQTNNSLFNEILIDLKISFNSSKGCSTSSTNENTSLSEEICLLYELKKLEAKDNLKGYKKLLIYFYAYMKGYWNEKIDGLIRIIKYFILTNKFERQNLEVLKKIIIFTSVEYHVFSFSFINDVMNKRETIYLNLSQEK